MNTTERTSIRKRSKGNVYRNMKCTIHYPTDPKIMQRIHKEVAKVQCAAAVKCMDNMGLNDEQKSMLIDSLLEDRRQETKLSETNS